MARTKDTARRSVSRLLLGALVIGATLLAMVPVASAHVGLQGVAPADQARLQQAPTSVRITFTGSVEDRVREVTLVSPDGEARTDSWTVEGPQVVVEVPSPAQPGEWSVSWRVLGGDGHPITGTSRFTVLEPDAQAGGDVPEEVAPPAPADPTPSAAAHAAHAAASSYPHDALEFAALLGRIAFFAGLLLFVGGMLFAMFAAPGWQPKLRRLTLAATLVGAWVVWATHAAMIDERSIVQMLDPRAWLSDARSVGVRGYLLASVFVIAANAARWRLRPDVWRERRGRVPVLMLALVAGAAISPSLSGHAVDGAALWVRVPLDMLHVLAGAAWLGGLVQVLTIARHERMHDPRMYAVVSRYSRVAAVSVGVLVATGLYAMFDEIDAGVGELLGSPWGRLVLAKAALLALTMPLANANRLRNVPDVRRAPTRGVPRLRRFVAWELAIIIWVVAATAMLVYETPPRSDAAVAASASHSG